MIPSLDSAFAVFIYIRVVPCIIVIPAVTYRIYLVGTLAAMPSNTQNMHASIAAFNPRS
ncbi:hypothetical protein BS47DRAFT_1336156 [Hydnum rufescens UP504]|uniref:Uncharacterized protein n=1 Tax=Hydnum rufescens UP504 TaxID=1448309 RepID=A0A9P6E1W1_9AGAM|nr:hypothetical protein BS47DRAFT_1336156 [Hydnum rufescens UP504]